MSATFWHIIIAGILVLAAVLISLNRRGIRARFGSLMDKIADRRKNRILDILRGGEMTAQQIVDASGGKLGYVVTRLILEWMTDESLVAWRDEEVPLAGFYVRRLYRDPGKGGL